MKFYDIRGTARISFGIYNTIEDIDYFEQSLSEITKILQ